MSTASAPHRSAPHREMSGQKRAGCLYPHPPLRSAFILVCDVKTREIFLWWWCKRKYLSNYRHYWIHPICRDHTKLGEFRLLPQIFSDEEKCMDFLWMKKATFDFLLTTCAPCLQKQDTNWRKAIPPIERLVVTSR